MKPLFALMALCLIALVGPIQTAAPTVGDGATLAAKECVFPPSAALLKPGVTPLANDENDADADALHPGVAVDTWLA